MFQMRVEEREAQTDPDGGERMREKVSDLYIHPNKSHAFSPFLYQWKANASHMKKGREGKTLSTTMLVMMMMKQPGFHKS